MKLEPLVIKPPPHGFSIVEALLAATILALVVTALVGAIIYGNQAAAVAGAHARADLLAEEGVEAARNIRDSSYSNLTTGTFGLALSGNQWALSGSSDTTDIFTRAVTIAAIDSNRTQITSTVSWQQTPQRTGSVSFITYLTNWQIAHVASWGLPVQEGFYDASGAQDGLKVQVQGNYAYVVRNDGTPDFLVINISTPSAPTLAASLNLDGAPTNLAISGNYAYVSTTFDSRELEIIDITTPTAPSVAGWYDAAGTANANGVFAVGTTVYMVRDFNSATTSREFMVINCATASAPTSPGSFNLTASAREVWVSGNYAYVASTLNSQELQVINFTNLSAITLAGGYNMSGNQNALTVTGADSTVYLGRDNGDLGIFSLTTASTPTLSYTYPTSGAVNDLYYRSDNRYLYIANDYDSGEFQVIDVTTATAPTAVGSVNITTDLNGIVYDSARDRAYGVGDVNNREFVVIAPS